MCRSRSKDSDYSRIVYAEQELQKFRQLLAVRESMAEVRLSVSESGIDPFATGPGNVLERAKRMLASQ